MSLATFYFIEFTGIYILLAWAVYLPFRAHQLFYGPIYCMAIGAYFAGYASRDLGVPIGLAIMMAVILCALFTLITAFKFANMSVFGMCIATMAIVFIVQTVARNLDFLGGANGLFGIPYLPKELLLAITYGVILVVGLLIHRIDHSYIGRAMDAAYVDREVAATLGINVNRLSVYLQVISGAIGGLSGALYAFTMGSVFPEAFGFFMILYAVTIVIVGGRYTIWGVIVATPILWGFSQFVPKAMAKYAMLMYGVLLVIMLLVRPIGIIDRKLIRIISTRSKMFLRQLVGSHKQLV